MTSRRTWAVWLGIVSGLGGLLGMPPQLLAQPAPTAREAAAAVPLDRVTPERREAVRQVVEQPTLFGRGPAEVFAGQPGLYHWFAGDGMVHGLRLADGEALWYRNRWIGTDSVRRAQGKPLAPGPRRGVSDTVNTNVFGHAGRVWASVEAGMLPVQLDDQLETVAEEMARKMAALPQRAVKTNKLLVNRVYELAGFRDALDGNSLIGCSYFGARNDSA